jgi:cellulose synthase/poly-beta-1,6-N-acetylglucosamine synthase-like glycosyltransferase
MLGRDAGWERGLGNSGTGGNTLMKICLKYALGVALCALSVAGPVFSQTSSAIRGRIIDPRGYRLTGLTVNAIGWTSGKQYQTATDNVGAFFFDQVEPDTYTISSECPGLERTISRVDAWPGAASSVELVALALAQFDRSDLTKYTLSTAGQGGRYPAGNISYLNVNDPVDTYFMLAYFGILIILSIYGVYRYRLVYLFLRYKDHYPQPKSRFEAGRLPRITVQLPLYNEMYVAERLVNAISEIDYPRELLEIQVLDDSTDETREIASRAVKRCFDQGLDITYRHRDNRIGFKAGALAEGLKNSTGDLVLIFDADFVPRPDCIRRMVDYFTDERVGLVQMRWSHINQDYSLLTKVQAIMLDGHFVIEQTARNRCGGFFNFNGTAGMWRRQAIEWSGGWQHDTLAEDTDLSYRAQLMGWRFVYLLDDDVPSELPVELNAFKSQQKRWAKGLVQVGLKMLKRIWHDPRLPLRVKLEQALRLTGNLAAPLVILLALINFPVLIVRYNQGLFHLFMLDVPILTLSTVSVVLFYVVPQWHLYPKTWKRSLKYIPFVLSMGIALTFSNARAVLEAVFGVKTPFVRTPKYGLQDSRDSSWLRKRYTRRRIQVPILETSFAIYFLFTIWYAAYSRIIGTIPFLLIYFVGYAYAAVMSIVQSRVKPRAATGKQQ